MSRKELRNVFKLSHQVTIPPEHHRHPRAYLAAHHGRAPSTPRPLYRDTDGKTYHVGYSVAGVWYELRWSKPWHGRAA